MPSMFSEDRFLRGRWIATACRQRGIVPLTCLPNIVGSGFGQRVASGERTEEPALVVYVARKVPENFLPPSQLLARRVYVGRDALAVDVVETGPFYPFAFTQRERPAPSGVSIGHPDVTAGTLGSLVRDNTDDSTCILSNNHVIAEENAATVGDAVVQPGAADGGSFPADHIARLKRFVPLDPAGDNIVDAAIAQPLSPDDVVDRVKDDLIPVATSDHPAVGLLFAGSCNRTLLNPIDQVLGRLDVSFLAGDGVTATADIGMNLEKVGRTTEYTTSTVTEIDVAVSVGYTMGTLRFARQVATAWMSEGGDSGSLVYRGGEGGAEDRCGCPTTAALSRLLGGVDLRLDAALEKELRTRYLRSTRTGRWLVDLYFENEYRLLSAARSVRLDPENRAFLRVLYDTYADAARITLLPPLSTDQRLTAQHLDALRGLVDRGRLWLSPDAGRAAEQLLQVAVELEGRSLAEILDRLDDEELFRRVRDIAASLPFLRLPEAPR